MTTVQNVLLTLDLLDNVINALEVGLVRNAVSVLPTLNQLANVAHVLKDGLDQNVTLVKDLDLALRVTALNVSRMGCGMGVIMEV